MTIAPQGSANSTLVTGLSGSLIHVDSSPDIVICIPAFNEEATIGDIVSRSKTYGTQIVVCDDGSADDTASEASKNGATVTTHLRNIGKGAALKTLGTLAIALRLDGRFIRWLRRDKGARLLHREN